MKVITAQEALDGFARYAVLDGDGSTYALFWNIEAAETAVRTLYEHDGGDKYEVAVIA